MHEDDVASAVMLALEREARGPFNLAIEPGWRSQRTVAAVLAET